MNEVTRDYTKKDFSTIIWAVLAVGAVICLGVLGDYGTNQNEINECNSWAQEAQGNPNYYLTKWQADQCAAHHITVDAPVK